MTSTTDEQILTEEIARLETQLTIARAKLNQCPIPPSDLPHNGLPSHPLLLLSDSALPLGSFAFSSGLESYLAHHPSSSSSSNPNPKPAAAQPSFPHFLTLALTTLATTTLPYLIAAHKYPEQLQYLDATLDACTLCPVARRASVAQGKALLTLWERALMRRRTTTTTTTTSTATTGAIAGEGDDSAPAVASSLALGRFSARLKNASAAAPRPLHCEQQEQEEQEQEYELSGHFAPIWAAVTCAMGVTLRESAYTFLLNHAKAVVSAAVRASVMGPYAAQGLLASGWLRGQIEGLMGRNWDVGVEGAGQGVPMCDLWIGRHELLYSRIFNS